MVQYCVLDRRWSRAFPWRRGAKHPGWKPTQVFAARASDPAPAPARSLWAGVIGGAAVRLNLAARPQSTLSLLVARLPRLSAPALPFHHVLARGTRAPHPSPRSSPSPRQRGARAGRGSNRPAFDSVQFVNLRVLNVIAQGSRGLDPSEAPETWPPCAPRSSPSRGRRSP
jgi:hypothetical protein